MSIKKESLKILEISVVPRELKIKSSIEPTHGSVCSSVRKLPSMNVLTWLSTKVE